MGVGKSTLYSILPPGTRYRELWLPELINSHATLPSSIAGGHPLALTGARKGTTAEGARVYGNNAGNDYINYGAIHDASDKLWVSLRFKLDQDWTTGGGTQRIWGKRVGAADYMYLYLDSGSGALYFQKYVGGGQVFLLNRDAVGPWNAGQWYHVIFSISDTEGARLRLDNGITATDADNSAVPNGGNFLLGAVHTTFGSGFKGVFADVVVGTDDLSEAEETDLYNGIPPVDAVNEWLLDEGRGVTAYDRGSGGNNGALATVVTWAWGECKQPVISLDGINDLGQSSAGVDVSGAITMFWAGKMKAHYDGTLADHYFLEFFIDNNNHYQINNNLITGDVRFLCVVGGVPVFADLSGFGIEIDDYVIFIGTVTAGGVIRLFANGLLHETGTGLPAIAAGGITAYIGAEDTPSMYDISKPLMVGLIDGAFTERQARGFSRALNDILGLGLRI